MVEGAPLLREYTREGIVGSNPIFSAIILQIMISISSARSTVRDRESLSLSDAATVSVESPNRINVR